MVAAGDKGGTVTVFRIPKPTPDWLPPSYKLNTNSNVSRKTSYYEYFINVKIVVIIIEYSMIKISVGQSG